MEKQPQNINITPLNISCPICNKNQLKLIHSITPIPYYGRIFIMSIKCENCNFKVSDILAVTYHKTKTVVEKICPNTINNLVVLSAGSQVEIPELGIEMVIETEQGGEITTIEGLILEFIELSKQLQIGAVDENSKNIIREIIGTLERERNNPSCKLTLKIVDETGKSAIIPYEAWVKGAEMSRKSVEIKRDELESLAKDVIKKFVKR